MALWVYTQYGNHKLFTYVCACVDQAGQGLGAFPRSLLTEVAISCSYNCYNHYVTPSIANFDASMGRNWVGSSCNMKWDCNSNKNNNAAIAPGLSTTHPEHWGKQIIRAHVHEIISLKITTLYHQYNDCACCCVPSGLLCFAVFYVCCVSSVLLCFSVFLVFLYFASFPVFTVFSCVPNVFYDLLCSLFFVSLVPPVIFFLSTFLCSTCFILFCVFLCNCGYVVTLWF